ncbi:MDM1 protein, partial [Centropus unirufus]|nr:MDM1 protein [Centropus unirufus]
CLLQGLSEYKRNFKWKTPEFCSPSQQQKTLWAGLRSDQFGITREPNFISKRRVPYHNPQISKSFEWTADCDLHYPPETEAHRAAKLHTDHNNNNDDMNQDKTETPEGPGLPPKVQSHSVDSRGETPLVLAENKMERPHSAAPQNQNEAFFSPKKELEKMGNRLHRDFQRKAGMNISRFHTFPRNSEYQSQFVWKSPHEKSPILAAEQVYTSKSVPPLKIPAITSGIAHERNLRGSSPVKDQQENGGSEKKEFPAHEQSKREEPFQKPAEDAAKQGRSEQKHPKQKNKQHISPKPLSLHTSRGKMNTEYRSKFLSPAQYFYKDGVWSRIRSKVPNQASQNTLNSMWYMEVRELRERAKAYRQQVEGTHFSRYHLNQILSDNNSLWDVSSTSSSEEGISNNIRALDLAGVSEKETTPSSKMLQQPDSGEQPHQDNAEKKEMSEALTVPVERRLVWGEHEGAEERGNQQSTEEELKQDEQATVTAQQLEESNKDANEDKKIEGENALVLNAAAESDSFSVSSGTCGRLPTPKLRALGGARRTHHDLTTPAVGGAVLVSPPKLKSSFSQQRTRGLGTDASSAKPGAREASKRRSFRPDVAMEAVSLLTSPPAGLGTLDPLPLRQDQWHPDGVADEQAPPASAHQEHSSIPPLLKSTKSCSVPHWSPSCRIQGTLKDPEFQHNGNIGNPKPRSIQLPLQERNYNDE